MNNAPIVETVNLMTDYTDNSAQRHEYFKVSCRDKKTNEISNSKFFYLEICIGHGYHTCTLKVMTASGWVYFSHDYPAGIKSYKNNISANKEEKIEICEKAANEFKEFAAKFVEAGLQF